MQPASLDTRETEWRGQGWTGAYPRNEAGRGTATGTTGTTAQRSTATGQQEVIALAEETLRIGKRVAHGGRGRVRSCTVETPVEEQVQLREETVRDTVRRTDVDEPSAANDPRKGKGAA